jgi:hypothetical protein
MSVGFGSPFGGGFDLIFTLFPIFFGIVFVIVIGGLLFNGARYIKNASSPRESVYARIISKRMEVRSHVHHHHTGEHVHVSNPSRTYYYITLEFDNGDRREFLDTRGLYGLVAEGDEGYAAIQGDWLVAFDRNRATTTVR